MFFIHVREMLRINHSKHIASTRQVYLIEDGILCRLADERSALRISLTSVVSVDLPISRGRSGTLRAFAFSS